MKQTIDGLVFKEMMLNAAACVEEHKQAINELNVFPVPDGDTGVNMSLTLASAAAELSKNTPTAIGKAAELAAGALLRGARGNSGVILSLLFRGFARSLRDKEEANAADIALAMSDGVTVAYKAVMKPSEGTILTVSRLAAAAACEAAETERELEPVFEAAIRTGYEALADTINLNPVLKKAGVIDAGGKGYMLVLEAMLAALRGEHIDFPDAQQSTAGGGEGGVFSAFNTEDITYAYCTEFIASRENDKDPALLWDFLGALGDSIVVVDDDEIIKVHVHSNAPGDVLTEALTYGSLMTVKVENMRQQHTETVLHEQEKSGAHRIAPATKPVGVVAVAAGAGLREVLTDLGADAIVSGGQTMNPSTEDILEEVDRTPAETVFVLPNNKNIILAAQQCIALSPKKVIVIPTETVPQGISAMLALDTDMDVETIEQTMLDSIGNVHTVSLTYAARDSVFDGIELRESDYLALLEGKLLASGPSLPVILDQIGEALGAFEPEYLTVYYGEDVQEEDAQALSATLSGKMPSAELTTVNGGQPVYSYIISAE